MLPNNGPLIPEYLAATKRAVANPKGAVLWRFVAFCGVTLWQTVPDVERVTACSLVAEICVEMKQFPTARHLASWAALCPGNHESAGKGNLVGPATETNGCGARFAKLLALQGRGI